MRNKNYRVLVLLVLLVGVMLITSAGSAAKKRLNTIHNDSLPAHDLLYDSLFPETGTGYFKKSVPLLLNDSSGKLWMESPHIYVIRI